MGIGRKIILGSASPRRRELMTEAGYEFEVIVAGVDEESVSSEGISVREYAERLALMKAAKVADEWPEAIVIGADTVVDLDGEIIGKAADAAEAEDITRRLFLKPHEVVTGVAVLCRAEGIEIVESDVTIVYPRKLTEEQIVAHINGDGWQGRAGAYGIKEKGDEFVERIEGSLTNVMGMPMELVEEILGRVL